jgi:hypothetical protein
VRGSVERFAIYAGLSVLVAVLNWVALSVISSWQVVRGEKRLEDVEVRDRAAQDLREILRREGMELDHRLEAARQEREQFLYALEERHAQQISVLAKEYQHEAHTVLRGLLDQLVAERLQPVVEQRLAEHRQTIEADLSLIDSAAAGETLSALRTDMAELQSAIDAAEARVAKARKANPDMKIEDKVKARLEEVEAELEAKVAGIRSELDTTLSATVESMNARVESVGDLLDEKVGAASDPLSRRMEETKTHVEARLAEYEVALDGRFAETERLLSERVVDQESALQERVVALESKVEERLGEHASAIEQVLSEHDEQLHGALTEQMDVVGKHYVSERERMMTELDEHAKVLQDRVTGDLQAAEDRARTTVEATQAAWNSFTEDLEARFAQTRDEALRAAAEIAEAERTKLHDDLKNLTAETSADITARVEEIGREAAWQRAQVERSVVEALDSFRDQAQSALADADSIYGDLERQGAERVERIRIQAEDALVQSRDYVAQLQESLSQHLDILRTKAEELGEGMNHRLAEISSAGRDTAMQLESYARELLDTTGRELATMSEAQVQALSQRLTDDMSRQVTMGMENQHRQFEAALAESAQRAVQQVQGDLAGMAEHARGAVTGELERMVAEAADHARRTQEQGFMEVMNELARQQRELAERAREATTTTRSMLEDSLRNNRRQLEEAMAGMGAHMREELVRFQDEGQRRVSQIIDGLRSKEHELLREEDRRLGAARGELVRQHQGALEDQVRNMVGGLTGNLANLAGGLSGPGGAGQSTGGNFTMGVDRPATPLADPSQGGNTASRGFGNGFGTL